jgi:hypothetical protein
VEVRGAADQVRGALNALPGVEGVDVLQNGPVCKLNVRAKATVELREQIAATIAQRGWALREMRAEGASLEEFFVRITDPGSAAA